MPRIARLVVPNAPHHITQRGIDGQHVFFDDEDRRLYLRILSEECSRWGMQLLAYCLMNDHVHLIAAPLKADALARAVGRTHWRYTQDINRVHGRSGHLWQNRFDSAPVDEQHLHLAIRYVEQNPVRARLCRRPWEYAWSSAAARCGWSRPAMAELLEHPVWRQTSRDPQWNSIAADPLEASQLRDLRRATSRGRPIAGVEWTTRLEQEFNRSLRARPVGRPRGAKHPYITVPI